VTAALNLLGQRFERLVVIERLKNDRKYRTWWLCQCDCGWKTAVKGEALVSGGTRSCGCLHREEVAALARQHGMSRTPTYVSWLNMRRRCGNPADSAYANYGGRGIAVCEAWQASFEAFYADMGVCPVGFTLERRDNDGPYSAENCSWASRKTQGHNRRTTCLVMWNGISRSITEWADVLGLARATVTRRLRNGWPIVCVLTAPRGTRKGDATYSALDSATQNEQCELA
jgi:hypothetical protein